MKYILAFLLTSLSFATESENIVQSIHAVNCNTKTSGYYCYIRVNSKLVSVIIPKDLAFKGQCLLHFHGYRIASWDSTAKGTIEYFNFTDSLNTKSPQTIMIAPVGALGGGDKYDLDANYNTAKKIQALLEGVSLRTGKLCKSVVLSGHSGAYRVLAPLAKELKSNEMFTKMFFFDMLYSSNVSPFSDWLAAKSTREIYNVSLGVSTTANSKSIKGKNYFNFKSIVGNHWNLVRDKYFSDFLAHIP